jgi:S-adenosylmethionine decarboxylase
MNQRIDAGQHLLLDLHNVAPKLLMHEEFVRNAMLKAATKTKAKILHSYFHHFGNNYGVTGVVAVSESHLSIHTWPEWEYASIDVYLCYGLDPKIAADSLVDSFSCKLYDIKSIVRQAYVPYGVYKKYDSIS